MSESRDQLSDRRDCPAGHGLCPCLPGSESEAYCRADAAKTEVHGMSNIEHCCECCGGDGTDAEWFIGAEGEDICARCAAKLLGAERDSLRQQLQGAVAALRALHRTDPARTLAACNEADPSGALADAVAPPHGGRS